MKNLPRKSLWTCLKTDYRMNEPASCLQLAMHIEQCMNLDIKHDCLVCTFPLFYVCCYLSNQLCHVQDKGISKTLPILL